MEQAALTWPVNAPSLTKHSQTHSDREPQLLLKLKRNPQKEQRNFSCTILPLNMKSLPGRYFITIVISSEGQASNALFLHHLWRHGNMTEIFRLLKWLVQKRET